MVEQDDVEGLASAISLVMGDASLRARLSAQGLETAKLHTWTVILDQLQDFYERVV
jgi:glycosyltransferase involved in cell wall biosynthesis